MKQKIIPILIVLTGFLLLFYPFTSNYLFEKSAGSTVESYQEKAAGMDQAIIKKVMDEAKQYNGELMRSSVQLTDPFKEKRLDGETVHYNRILNIDGKNILVIQIPVINNSNRPFMVKKQIGKLKENEIYIRKGSTTGIANKKDLEYMFKENKNSKLVVQSYSDGNLFDKIQLSEVNSIIEKYKEKKFEKLKQLVNDINQLKGKEFSFGVGVSFLISDEVESFLRFQLQIYEYFRQRISFIIWILRLCLLKCINLELHRTIIN